MRYTGFFLFLQLWAVVDVSLSLEACSKLPALLHGHVSDATNKSEYQERDVIHFSCDAGFIADQISKFVCTSEGWLAIHRGTCYSCATLPDVPHARVAEETRRDKYREGDIVHFTCDPGFSSDFIVKYVCTSNGWLTVRRGSCYITASSCELPPAQEGLTIKGLPEQPSPIPPDHVLTFSCDGPGKYLIGSSVLLCGRDGQWNNPFPSCAAPVNCGIPPPLSDGDTKESLKYVYAHNERVEFRCQKFYVMGGEPYRTCINGEWKGDMKCLKPCTINKDIMNARNIRFRFTNRSKLYMHHNEEVELACIRGEPVQSSLMRTICLDGEIRLPTCQ